MSDLENFRVEVKDWLNKNCPSTMRAGAPADTPIDEVWGGRKAVYKNPDSKLWLDRMGEKHVRGKAICVIVVFGLRAVTARALLSGLLLRRCQHCEILRSSAICEGSSLP